MWAAAMAAFARTAPEAAGVLTGAQKRKLADTTDAADSTSCYLEHLVCTVCLELPESTVNQVAACAAAPTDTIHSRTSRLTLTRAPPILFTQCTNGHIICATCLLAHRQSDRGDASQICPTCRKALGETPIRNLFAETFIGDQPGLCEGCGVSMLRKELVAHRQRCDEVTVECMFEFAGCDTRPRRKDLHAHIHTDEAEHLALLAILPVGGLLMLLSNASSAAVPIKVAATNALRDRADDTDSMFTIVQAGAIHTLVALLRGDGTDPRVELPSGSQADTLKQAALGALRKLAFYDINRSRIVQQPCAIKYLIVLLSDESDGVKEMAVDVLFILSIGHFTCRMDGAIIPIVTLLHEGTDRAKEAAVKLLNNLCFDNPGIRMLSARAGAIAPLICMLSGDETDMCKELAACALRNLAINTNNKMIIARAGAIAPLVALLSTGATDGCNAAAAGALGNLAKNTDIHAAIARAGAIPLLVALRSGGGTDRVTAMSEFALWRLGVDADNEMAIAQAGGRLTRGRSTKRNLGRAWDQ